MKEPKNLRIYTASAGSGKTHTLTGEYLRLALRSRGAFRYIQAVTFTNKATGEMKERILEELNNLAEGRGSAFKEELSKELSLTEEKLQVRAREVLMEILNDYSSLRVKTIDSFFQEVMRAFSHEMGLPGGFRIEMEQNVILDQAVVRLLHNLGEKETSDIENWLRRLAEDLIEEGKGHNIRKEMVELGNELFKETLMILSEEKKLPSKPEIHRFQSEMYKLIESFEDKRMTLAQEAEKIVSDAGISFTDFKGGSRSPILEFAKVLKGEKAKIPSKTFMVMPEGDPTSTLYTKTAKEELKEAIMTAYQSGLKRCIEETVALYSGENWCEYCTAKQTIPFLNRLGIITDIWQQIEEIRQEENKMLISDTSSLLHKIIDGSETPFIYDKIGVRIEHEMIDEFQDTSRLQYENFKPLLQESIAHGKYNLLVGDAKQSIYRFRNADRTLLTDSVGNDFDKDAEKVNLPYNWRSTPEIVDFNNALYDCLPHILSKAILSDFETTRIANEDFAEELSQTFLKTYADVKQIVPPNKDQHGVVQVHTSDGEASEDNDSPLSWEEEILAELPRFIIDLQKRGYTPSDIAILVRNSHQASDIAASLLAYEPEPGEEIYPLIPMSDESLLLNGAASIRLFFNAFKGIAYPWSESLRQIAFLSYKQLCLKVGTSPAEEKAFSAEQLNEIADLRRRSLYELAEGLVTLFYEVIPEDETPYVIAWLDMINEFSHGNSADLRTFIKWWEEVGSKKNKITSAPNSEAISLMTIHKAKGLGFRVVLLPFLDWVLDDAAKHGLIKWCKIDSDHAPFNNLSVVPIKYKKEMGQTIFAAEYLQERANQLLDNLNLLYVATTRAKDEMHLWLPPTKKADSLQTIGDLIHQAIRAIFGDEDEGESIDYTWGTSGFAVRHEPSEESHARISFKLPKGRPSAISEHLAIRPEGSEFYRRHKPLHHGQVMHRILSEIILTEDIRPTLERYISEGIVGQNELDELADRLSMISKDKRLARWFDGSGRVLNEQDILLPDGGQRRPDRIVIFDNHTDIIDYKFGSEHRSHQQQIRNYIDLLSSLGYPDVHGYLWYLTEDLITEVKD